MPAIDRPLSDCRYGSGAFNQDVEESIALAQSMLAAGERAGKQTTAFVRKNDEFCIKNEKCCIKNKELCIKNEELCIKTDELCRSPQWTSL